MKTLLALLLLIVSAMPGHTAQSIVIPQGVSTYGPFTVNNALHRRLDIGFIATSNSFTLMTIRLERSMDKGNTWIFNGESFHEGGQPLPTRIGSFKLFPEGTTHVRAIVTVAGGSVTIAAPPNVNTSPK
jgi:hypothetical protein